jgi:hypothetical protein
MPEDVGQIESEQEDVDGSLGLGTITVESALYLRNSNLKYRGWDKFHSK